MTAHEKYMRRCIDLALLGAGRVSPNPMVGAVIVHEDKIIGEGFHQQFGEAHAEVNAVEDALNRNENAAELLRSSIIYINLEPCAHFGKTPPCTDLIIRYEIPKAVIGCRDPFDPVNGKGIEKLRSQGIEVIEDILKEECINLNKRFFTRIREQRPYIILKWAQTADGFFAPADGSQQWITSPLSKALVHRWRSEEDAVLVGKNTVSADNPQLNVREWKGRNPKRIIIDRNLELPHNLHIFDQSVETIVFNSIKTDIDDNIKYIAPENFDHYLPQYILYQLYLMDIQSVLIEGGAETLNSFLHAGLWDEARILTGPQKWGNGIPAPKIAGSAAETYQIGMDKLEIFEK